MPDNITTVLGVKINNLKRTQVLEKIKQFVTSQKPHQIVTVNAEFLVAAQNDPGFRMILHTADLNTADGMGVLWAAKYLTLPITDLPLIKWLQSIWQLIYTGLAVVFYPSYIKTVIVEKISGTDLIWDIAALAEREGYRLFLLGGYENTPELVKEKLLQKYPRLKIAGLYSGRPEEEGIVEKINQTKPDILLVAFGPVRQEKWIAENLQKLRISAAIGLGGTFDYLAGKKPLAPHFLRSRGLEWAFRLITQPYRIKRIYTAVIVFPWYCLLYKIQQTKPYRKNVVACVVNDKNQILLCRRQDENESGKEHWQLPQGGVDENETYEEALAREIKEETGLTHLTVLGKVLHAHHYDWPSTLAKKSYEGKYRGQSQSIFYVRADLKRDQIRLDHKEFNAYKWVNKEELINAVHPFRRTLAEKVIENFDKFIKS